MRIRGQEAHPAAFEQLAGALSGLRPEVPCHRPGGDLQQAAQLHEGGDPLDIADHVLVALGVRDHRADFALPGTTVTSLSLPTGMWLWGNSSKTSR